MPAIRQGAAPSFTRIYRGATPIKEIRRGSTLVWSSAPIHSDDWIDWWVHELCDLVHDPGKVIGDGLGNIIDGLGNIVGTVVKFVEGGANGLGTLVASGGDTLINAYCGIWGGSAPNGLLGLINGIPIIGPIIGSIIDDFLTGTISIEHLVGQIPVVGQIGQAIGLLPDAVGNLIDTPINFVVDAAGNVVGTITCGAFTDVGGAIADGLCFLIGVGGDILHGISFGAARQGIAGARSAVAATGQANPAGQSIRLQIPDGLMSLDMQTSRARNTVLANSDNGYLEVQLATLGDPGYVTQVFRRYDNSGQGTSGVGIDVRDGTASIVRRLNSVNDLVAPGLGGVGPGDRLYLDQSDNTHILLRNGDEIGRWVDGTGTAAKGASNLSVGTIMQAGKEMLGPRRFSPALTYIRAA